VSETAASWINICSQLGYGLGLFFVVPIGDMVSRRKLLIMMQLFAALAVSGAALSQTIGSLYFFSLAIGITATACQVYVPLAAHLANEEERGKVIGTIMGGLLSGILLSRTLSGLAADYSGALISPQVGKISDRKGTSFPMRWGVLLMIAGYLILFASKINIGVLVIGIILIDGGLQCAHIPNLTRVSELSAEARTRLNTIYMTSFFIGGTIGSIVGSYAWNMFSWVGVCTVGLILVLLASLPIYLKRKT
jgi:MFS family permease